MIYEVVEACCEFLKEQFSCMGIWMNIFGLFSAATLVYECHSGVEIRVFLMI
jgi:hypothetical protein